jgi:hypothetical protein
MWTACGGAHRTAHVSTPADAPGPAPEHEFANTELDVKNRVFPEFPAAARHLEVQKHRCKATVRIDEKGVPYDVSVAECPEVFVQPTVDAMMAWRWRPPMFEGHSVRAVTVVPVVYVKR